MPDRTIFIFILTIWGLEKNSDLTESWLYLFSMYYMNSILGFFSEIMVDPTERVQGTFSWSQSLGIGGFGKGTHCLSDVGADGPWWSKVIAGCHLWIVLICALSVSSRIAMET